MKLTEDEASELLKAATGEAGEYRATLDLLAPKLLKYIGKVCMVDYQAMFAEALVEADDVGQEVLIRLLRSPPEPAPAGRALPRLLAWLKFVAHNFLVDRYRKMQRRIQISRWGDSDHSRAITEGRTEANQSGALVTAQHADSIRDLLRACQPACLPLFELLLEGEELESVQVAERLGTTRANVDTLRRRMRITRDVWLALEEAPERTLEDVAEQIGRPANAELKRTLRKVQHYLAIMDDPEKRDD